MKYSKVLIFAGTTEGRKLAEYLVGNNVRLYVCVATEYGKSLLPEGKNITVFHERMDSIRMEEIMREYEPEYVIDATHPYASEVTCNIRQACKACGKVYLRLIRESSEAKDCVYVDNIEEAVTFLEGTQGNILATTGSKELGAYTRLENYETRLYARVLSLADVVKKCEELKISGRHLICMQGPFSIEMNVAMMKEYHIAYLVTKESGKTGGFPEKYEAAKQAGARLVVIGRPAIEEGYYLEEICGLLKEKLKLAAEIQKEKRKVSLVGIGTGAEQFFTAKAKETCEKAELIIGAKRMVEAVIPLGQAVPEQDTFISYKPEEIAAYIKDHPEYKKVAVVLSGDVGFYSGSKRLLSMLKAETENGADIEIEVIPGISSIVYFCAKLGITWEDAALISIHGKQANIISAIRDNQKTIALVGSADGIRKLSKDMVKYGYGNLKVSVGEELSYPAERILTETAEKMCNYEGSGLAVIYVENPDGGRRIVNGGISDDAFLRGKVPMTKEEVRSVSLSKLRIQKNSIIYDVGAGTGSVSVEAAMLAKYGQVYAIEMKEEAIRLIEENKYKFGTDNLNIIHAEAKKALEELPMPDCVFIGGSKGNMKEILHKVTQGNPKVRIVINAISLETLSETVQCLKEMKEREEIQITEEEIVQLSVAKSKNVGNYHMMMGQNPIFIISFTSESKGKA